MQAAIELIQALRTISECKTITTLYKTLLQPLQEITRLVNSCIKRTLVILKYKVKL